MSNSDDGDTPSTDETSSPLIETITAETNLNLTMSMIKLSFPLGTMSTSNAVP